MTSKQIDLDGILGELGQFGRYQVQTYCFILLPIIFSAVYTSQYIFTAGETRYRCYVPVCESSPPSMEVGSWGEWALPSDPRCSRYVSPDSAQCQPEYFSNETERCDQWVYEHNHTIVSTFDLGCEDWKQRLVGTIHSVGLFVALPYTGYISDTFGRRSAFIVTSVSAGLMGLIRSFSPNYIMYILLEFLDAVFGSGVYSTGFILALEMVGPKRRVLGGNVISCAFAVGQVVLALVAWAVPYWRTLTVVLYVPSLLFIFYYLVIEESVRWLLTKGNKKEAARIIYKAAAINKKKLSPATIKALQEDTPIEISKQTEVKTEESKSLALEVLRSRVIMARLAICSFWWITTTFIYYGLSINSVSLAGNSYVNYILMSLVEIPGYAMSVLLLDRLGRKTSIMSAFFICGTSLVAFPFVPQHLTWLLTCLTMLGKLCISMAFSSIYIYTSELFPTGARHRLLAVCSMVGRIGSIVAPQTPALRQYMESLPYLLFGVMAGAAGLLMTLTPETLNRPLPDTVRQAEDINRKKATVA